MPHHISTSLNFPLIIARRSVIVQCREKIMYRFFVDGRAILDNTYLFLELINNIQLPYQDPLS